MTNTATIALTEEYSQAVRMNSLLEEQGFHPEPVQPLMQVTAFGGERGFRIAVPAREAGDAAAELHQRGFEECLRR